MPSRSAPFTTNPSYRSTPIINGGAVPSRAALLTTSPSYRSALIINGGAVPSRAALLYYLLYTVHSTQYIVHSTQYTVHGTQYTVHSTPYTVHSTRYTVHSTQYTVHSLRYTVHHGGPPVAQGREFSSCPRMCHSRVISSGVRMIPRVLPWDPPRAELHRPPACITVGWSDLGIHLASH